MSEDNEPLLGTQFDGPDERMSGKFAIETGLVVRYRRPVPAPLQLRHRQLPTAHFEHWGKEVEGEDEETEEEKNTKRDRGK